MPWPITNILILQHKLNLNRQCKRLCALQSKDSGTLDEEQSPYKSEKMMRMMIHRIVESDFTTNWILPLNYLERHQIL